MSANPPVSGPAGAAAAGVNILVMSRVGARSLERAQLETQKYGRPDRYGRSGRPHYALLLLLTVSPLPFCMANCLCQPRSARQMVCSHRPKVGVGSHSHGHFPEQPKTFLPTNVGTADAMGSGFMREREGFTVNSRAGRSQLLRWTLDQKKPWPVTGKRMRRRQDMRSAPVGPAGGMRNVSTDQGVSSRGQPVDR